MKTIRVNSVIEIPKDYTGIVEYSYGTKYWYKEGKLHREDGPAIEYTDGYKEWWIDGVQYSENVDIEDKFFLGKEKGKYDLEWVRFLDKEEIEEYPIIPGMKYVFYTTSIDDLK
jgi:hypothetical protein